jgi:hypothetical protein
MVLWRLGVAAAGKRLISLGGYIVNGNTPARQETYQKNTFATDTLSILSATVNSTSGGGSSCLYSTTNGYVLQNMTVSRTANKLSYATETRSLTGNIIAAYPGSGHTGQGLSQNAGLNSSTNGYLCGGSDESGVRTTNINKFNFSTEAQSLLATGLSSARRMWMGVSSSTAGYVGNGRPAGDVYQSVVQKVTFSSDSVSTLGTGLTNELFGGICFYSTSAGYMGGGSAPLPDGSSFSTINKFSFSDDSRSTLTSGLLPAGLTVGAGNESSTAGYVSGGRISDAIPRTSARYKWSFSDDSRSTLGTNLPVDISDLSWHSHKVSA